MTSNEAKQQAAVWTVFVRIAHWLVAIGVLISFFNDTGFWHRFIGYSCLMLVLLRICYGLWLSKTASSKFYIPTVTQIKLHLNELSTQHFSPQAGHNPLGQWAVYAIWTLIILLALTGWLSRTDAYWGEDWPVDLHAFFSNALMLMVLLHVSAIALISKLQKRNLAKRMITGKS